MSEKQIIRSIERIDVLISIPIGISIGLLLGFASIGALAIALLVFVLWAFSLLGSYKAIKKLEAESEEEEF